MEYGILGSIFLAIDIVAWVVDAKYGWIFYFDAFLYDDYAIFIKQSLGILFNVKT